jgi:plastin-1
MMGLISQFRTIDIEEKGSVDKQSLIKSVQESGEENYDQVRETLKEVNLDSSGRVELEDYVDVSNSRAMAFFDIVLNVMTPFL